MRNSESHIFLPKNHRYISVKWHVAHYRGYTKPARWQSIPEADEVGAKDVSCRIEKVLNTLFIALSFSNREIDTVLETKNLDVPMVEVFKYMWTLNNADGVPFTEHIKKLAWVKWREEKSVRQTGKYKGQKMRGGRRQKIRPILMVVSDLEAFIGRAFRTYTQFRRAIYAGDKPRKIQLPDGFELEIAQLNPGGNGCSAEFYIHKDRKIMRLVLFNLKGHLNMPAEQAAEEFLEGSSIVVPPTDYNKKEYDSYSPAELEQLKRYALNNATLTRELYDKLRDTLTSISPYVIRRNGMIPNSVAGAAMRTALSMASVDQWQPAPYRYTQMGALNNIGGRVFLHQPWGANGHYENLYLYDGSQWHNFLQRQLPDPCTCTYSDIPAGPFNLENWQGKYGYMLISGTVTDNLNSPIVTDDPKTERVKYIKGPFTRVWASIPAIVIGVVSNRLEVTHIHDGAYMEGDNEISFLSRFSWKMQEIRDRTEPGTLLHEYAKLMANSLPGKLKEVNSGVPWISPLARSMYAPEDLDNDEIQELINAYIEGPEILYDKAEEKLVEHDTEGVRFGRLLDRYLGPSATTGVYYMPFHGNMITSMSSAMLALAAHCTGAISGYTDSLITRGDANEGLAEYRRLVQEAGYEAPESGPGSFRVKIANGEGWIARPGTWVIRSIDTTTGEVRQIQALHLLEHFNGDAWKTIKDMCLDKSISYETEDHPLSLLQAYHQGVEPGTLVSETRKIEVAPLHENELDKEAIERSKRLLTVATNKIANRSTHDIPTIQTSQGCIKILTGYGLNHREIANRRNISISMVHQMASGKKDGRKYLTSLQELVTEVEQERLDHEDKATKDNQQIHETSKNSLTGTEGDLYVTAANIQ